MDCSTDPKKPSKKLYCLPPGYYRPRKEPFNTDRHCRHVNDLRVATGEKWGIYQFEEGYLWVGKHCLLLEEEVLLITSKKPRLLRMFYLFQSAKRYPKKTKFAIQIPVSSKRKERVCLFDRFSSSLDHLKLCKDGYIHTWISANSYNYHV